MARNIPRMVGMAALLLLLSGTATATSYPSADQYSLRNHYRITRRSAGHETLPTVATDHDEDELERRRQAVSLTELLELWEPERREDERRPLQRGDIEVTTRGVERGDVPVIGKRKKLARRQAPMWGYAEDEGMLPSDEEARPAALHPHRKHHRNPGLIETDAGNGPIRWRGPEEETRQRTALKVDRRRFNGQPSDRQRYDEEEQRRRLYEMRRTPEETQRRDGPDAGNEGETRRRQEEQQRRENPRQNDNRADETRRRQEEEERRRADYEARRREQEQQRPNDNDRREQSDIREEDETRRRQEEEEERQRALDARRREEEQRQRGRNPPADEGDTYEKRMQEWRKKKEEHDRLVRERELQRQQHHPQQVDPAAQRPEAQTKSQEELENERKLQEYIRRNTPIAVPPSGSRDPASERLRENEQVRRAEHERRLEEERRRKQVLEESRRLAEEERTRRTHEGEDAGRNRTRHRGTSPVRPRWPAINPAVTSRTPLESSRRPIPQSRPEEGDGRYLESRRNEAAAAGLNSRRPSSEAEKEEERLKRLKGLPVSATIIVRSTDTGANRTSTPPPALNLRFGEDIDFPGFSPNRRGPEASRFPAPVTRRPPVPSPQPCVWAIVVCCQQHRQQAANQAMKITRCFEATNCPGASWDVDRRCSVANVRAANEEIREFYLKGQERNY
ncbi:trichohyalin [Nasonia vitripennis]|uniref:Trichohyalin n=1 Tax=Nasonia vitripennis TaxID=7425 RepID=A0A7M7IPL6_NASVI|nr:trichohyalin [Nasonia vitripennis]